MPSLGFYGDDSHVELNAEVVMREQKDLTMSQPLCAHTIRQKSAPSFANIKARYYFREVCFMLYALDYKQCHFDVIDTSTHRDRLRCGFIVRS